jgi:hypothetical protein
MSGYKPDAFRSKLEDVVVEKRKCVAAQDLADALAQSAPAPAPAPARGLLGFFL